MIYIKKYLGLTVFLFSILAISSALIAENFLGLLPCKMCLQQRYPYYFIIVIFIIFFFLKKTSNKWLYFFIELSFLYGLFYSIWHVGIEKKIFKETSCSRTINSDTIENLKEQIMNQPLVNCSDVNWSIFGFSAATLNAFFLIIFLFFNSILLFKLFYEKEN